jgi:hypothetical protein
MYRMLGALLVTLTLVPAAQARVHSLDNSQFLVPPNNDFPEGFPAVAVAIDGDSLIVIADRIAGGAQTEGRFAYLYRRAANGKWSYNRTLLQTTINPSLRRAGLAMKNSIAVIDLDSKASIWEKRSGNWVQAETQGSIELPGGYAISGNSILIGGTGCNWDGFIYQKNTSSGQWRMTGRLPLQAGVCSQSLERDVELNYDYALINEPAGAVRVYRRNGTAVDWVSGGTFPLQGQSAGMGGSLALQNTLAAAPGSTIYRRNGAAWNLAGTLVPLDYDEGSGEAERVVYRDGVLLTVEGLGSKASSTRVHAYALDPAGAFREAAVLFTTGNSLDVDISGTTIAAATEDELGRGAVQIFKLPTPLFAPDAIPNDFNAHDVSGFQQTVGSSFVLGGNRYNYIYRQPNTAGEAHSVLTATDWNSAQWTRALVRVNALNGADAWAGLAIRYVDADNFYAVVLHGNTADLVRRLDGVTTVLDSGTFYSVPANDWHHVRIGIKDFTNGPLISVQIDEEVGFGATDSSLQHGRVALITRNARADYDDLYAAPTLELTTLSADERYPQEGRPLTRIGGLWAPPDRNNIGVWPPAWRQLAVDGLALALGATSTDFQQVKISARLDSWGAANPVPWFGVIARYVDSANYYYASVRGTNQLQIRKVVGGVTTVLAATSLTVAPGDFHDIELQALGNELHALVDGKLVATALDDDIKKGRYGYATYHTAASFSSLVVSQP